jgi:hypothetical protein
MYGNKRKSEKLNTAPVEDSESPILIRDTSIESFKLRKKRSSGLKTIEDSDDVPVVVKILTSKEYYSLWERIVEENQDRSTATSPYNQLSYKFHNILDDKTILENTKDPFL